MKKVESKKDNRALYRKYRGRQLNDVVGQTHVTSSLDKSLKAGNVSHAYLFSGPRGTGKTSVARILAHLVNDLPYSDDSTHLDIIEIDAASNRRIDDIRDLREKVHIAPVQARFKVYIIDEVHMLTTDSFNALLKTLEEPPEYVIFILATTEPHKLPETIISRTQHYQFKPMDQATAARHLEFIANKEGLSYEPAALELLAQHGQGSMRDSVSMLDQISGSGQKITVSLVEEILGLVPLSAINDLLGSLNSGDIASLETKLSTILNEGIDANALATQIYQALKEDLIKNPHGSFGVVDLMKELLEVNSAYNSSLHLETVLLKHALNNADSTTQPKTQQITKAPEPPAKPKKVAALTIPKTEQAILKAAKNNGKISAKSQALDSQLWQQIIEDIKKTNNTLAGLLRQTKVQLNGQTLAVICPYSFHVKRLKTSSYLSRLTSAVTTVLGDQIVIDVYHETSSEVSVKEEVIMTITPQPNDPKLESIQNIMGGGEIINV
jgi:DNA polymerase-3 subunit gamma/tau